MGRILESCISATLTFNRFSLVKENLNAICAGEVVPETVLIFDNQSTDGSYERLQQFLATECDAREELPVHKLGGPEEKIQSCWRFTKKITDEGDETEILLVRAMENLFAAGGFATIFELIFNLEGKQYLWVMDDDGYPASKCLHAMAAALSNCSQDYAAVTPLTYCADHKNEIFAPWSGLAAEQLSTKSNDLEDKLSPFNGSLYRINKIREVGSPDPRYHIWGDEDDYRFRILAKYRTLCVLSAVYYHPRLHKYEDYLFGKYSIAPPGRIYYSLRNHTYFRLHRGYNTPFFRMFLKHQLVSAFFRREHRFRSFILNFLALYHGAVGDFSNKVNGSK
ncbi:hypothetical protein OAO10_05065 [Luminiphilus sp.]|nr:hypothetical protein [Luminiphilus sp.]